MESETATPSQIHDHFLNYKSVAELLRKATHIRKVNPLTREQIGSCNGGTILFVFRKTFDCKIKIEDPFAYESPHDWNLHGSEYNFADYNPIDVLAGFLMYSEVSKISIRYRTKHRGVMIHNTNIEQIIANLHFAILDADLELQLIAILAAFCGCILGPTIGPHQYARAELQNYVLKDTPTLPLYKYAAATNTVIINNAKILSQRSARELAVENRKKVDYFGTRFCCASEPLSKTEGFTSLLGMIVGCGHVRAAEAPSQIYNIINGGCSPECATCWLRTEIAKELCEHDYQTCSNKCSNTSQHVLGKLWLQSTAREHSRNNPDTIVGAESSPDPGQNQPHQKHQDQVLCPICMCVQKNIALGCRHTFCAGCINAMKKSQLVPKCPMCRSPISTIVEILL